MRRKGGVKGLLALGLLSMLIPLGSAWNGEQEPWRLPGWRWGIDPLPIRVRQPSLSGPRGYFDRLTPRSWQHENFSVGALGAFEKVLDPIPDSRGDDLDSRIIAGVTSVCAKPVTAPASPPPPDRRLLPCPPPPSLAARRVEPIVLQPVPFEFDQSRLLPLGRRVLDETAQTVQETSFLSVEVKGHTDTSGMEVHYLGLGKRCDELVKGYGVLQPRIDPQRLTSLRDGEARTRSVAMMSTQEVRPISTG
jgi:outer membrane protein OmpA-like peptidoglycan-associated protein